MNSQVNKRQTDLLDNRSRFDHDVQRKGVELLIRQCKMHPHEEATIRAFISPPRRRRWLESLASAKRRRRFLDRLNHCRDFDERYAKPLESNVDIVAVLRDHGATATCYVLSDTAALDGKELPLAEAVTEAETNGWDTIIICLPGRLAYYYDECGERRMLLERKA